MDTLYRSIVLLALALLTSVEALAQDVTMRFDNIPVEGTPGYENIRGSIWTYTKDGVKVQYIPGNILLGACIYNTWADYDIIVTSSQPIAVIELDGYSDTRYATNTSDVVCTTGTLKMHPDETSVWTGKSTSITFRGARASSRYQFTEMRFWFVGTPYGNKYVAEPTVTATNGSITFASETAGTTFTYNVQLTTDGKVRMCDGTVPLNFPLVVNVHGEAAGYEKSPTTTTTIPLTTLRGKKGDANGDGKVTTQDVQTIVDNLLNKTAK